MESNNLGKQQLIWLLLILTLGFVTRMAIWVGTSDTGLQIYDERDYARLAQNLLNGNGFALVEGKPTSIRPPLYPAFIASIWWLTGVQDLQAVRFAQILLSCLSVCLVYFIGRRAFSGRVALVGAGVFCLYPTYVGFASMLYAEILFVFLLLLISAIYLLLQSGKKFLFIHAIMIGLFFGLAALTRTIAWPLFLVFIPLVFFTVQHNIKTRLLITIMLVLGFASIIAPWAYRNTQVQNEFTLIDTMGGMNLMMGNYEHTPMDRAWDAVVLITTSKGWSYNLRKTNPESRFWSEKKLAKWASQQAKEYMINHPYLTLKRSLNKFFAFWGLERVIIAAWKNGFYFPGKWSVALGTAAILLSYVCLMMVAVVGFFLALPHNRAFHIYVWFLVIVVTAIHVLVFGHSRYHLPLIPFFALYAASAIDTRAWQRLKDRSWPSYAAIASLILLIFIWGREVLFVEGNRIELLLNRII